MKKYHLTNEPNISILFWRTFDKDKNKMNTVHFIVGHDIVAYFAVYCCS